MTSVLREHTVMDQLAVHHARAALLGHVTLSVTSRLDSATVLPMLTDRSATNASVVSMVSRTVERASAMAVLMSAITLVCACRVAISRVAHLVRGVLMVTLVTQDLDHHSLVALACVHGEPAAGFSMVTRVVWTFVQAM